jgi:lipoyl(octanoyl) transferase|tara:strand:- start:257 stop:880 length:624 start_codon:yes stop_codon:yes gene_type:complete
MNIEVKISKKKIDYNFAINYMEKRLEKVIKGEKFELLWILEHNSIYTGGIRSDKKDILNRDIKVIKTNRGGKITHHGPGQKIIYFVINLNKRKKDIRYLLTKIEKCIIKILKHYKINSFSDRENVGIWVKEKKNIKKIAAIGIKVKKWVAFHGFSINVDNDLDYYKNIIPCGISDKGITRIKDLTNKNLRNINQIIKKNLIISFKKI